MESQGFESVKRHYANSRSKYMIITYISFKKKSNDGQIVTAEHWFDACGEHLVRRAPI